MKLPSINIRDPYTIAGLSFLIVFMIAIIMFIASLHRVPDGYIGVRVKGFTVGGTPITETLPAGLYMVRFGQAIHDFPTHTITYEWLVDTRNAVRFESQEGIPVAAGMSVTMRIDPATISKLFVKYRSGVNDLSKMFIRNTLYDATTLAASRYTLLELRGTHKQDFRHDIEERVRAVMNDYGLIIERVQFIDEFAISPAMQNKLDELYESELKRIEVENALAVAKAQLEMERVKIEQEHEQIIDLARAEAMATITRAESLAEANRILTETISPELIRWYAIDKWDGVGPKTTGGAIPFLDPNQ